MTREEPIPEAALQRLRGLYAALEQTATIVAEAMGIPAAVQRHLDLQRGLFLLTLPDELNGRGTAAEVDETSEVNA